MGRLINIGYGNMVNSDKVVCVVSPDGAPIKRLVQSVKNTPSLIDATQGRKTKSVIFTSEEMVILSAMAPETIAKRFSQEGRLSAGHESAGEEEEEALEEASQES